jgi:hypothetical protein
MRTRLQTLLPFVLALTLVSLLVAPLATLAQSGLPATISMYPETAGPGSTVEVTGIDFPPERVVEVQLTTPDGTVPLTTLITSPEGDFRRIMALPINAADGAWEVQATAADGDTAAYAFITAPEVVAAADAADAAVVQPATTAGNSSGDIALMLIIALMLGSAAFGAMIVYRQIRNESPPGMGKGEDLIWGGGTSNAGPEQTATEEPHWKGAQRET